MKKKIRQKISKTVTNHNRQIVSKKIKIVKVLSVRMKMTHNIVRRMSSKKLKRIEKILRIRHSPSRFNRES
jgi:hypothetical protein